MKPTDWFTKLALSIGGIVLALGILLGGALLVGASGVLFFAAVENPQIMKLVGLGVLALFGLGWCAVGVQTLTRRIRAKAH